MAIAIIAVLMGASIPSAMLTVSQDISEKVSYEFRKYGANLLIVPTSDTIDVGFPGVEFGSVTEQRYMNESDLWKIKSIYWRNNVLGFAPFLYQLVKVGRGSEEQRVALVGTYFNRDVDILNPYSPNDDPVFTTGIEEISPWWNVEGRWVDGKRDDHGSMIGKNVANKLGLELGDLFVVRYSERPDDAENETTLRLTVTGIVNTDGYEDDQIFVDMALAQNLTSRSGKLHTVQVSALCNECPVDTFARQIEEKITYVEARTVKQLVSAEMNILNKVEKMMLLVTVVAVLASALGMSATMTSSVIERRREIGLMKSIGAGNKRIGALFLMEAVFVGMIGGVAGYLIGIALAQFIGMNVFGSAISPQLNVLPTVLFISLGITAVASLLPVRRALRIEPAIVLRGE